MKLATLKRVTAVLITASGLAVSVYMIPRYTAHDVIVTDCQKTTTGYTITFGGLNAEADTITTTTPYTIGTTCDLLMHDNGTDAVADDRIICILPVDNSTDKGL